MAAQALFWHEQMTVFKISAGAAGQVIIQFRNPFLQSAIRGHTELVHPLLVSAHLAICHIDMPHALRAVLMRLRWVADCALTCPQQDKAVYIEPR